MPLDRPPLIDWYRRNRARSRALFDLVDDEAYYTKPIALRHPIVFYEGHLPAFSFNTLVKKALGGASIDGRRATALAQVARRLVTNGSRFPPAAQRSASIERRFRSAGTTSFRR